METNHITTTCAYCGTPIHQADGVWVDETDGDCCWGDDNLVNENQQHTPERAYTTDNRWSPGASGATVPEGAVAAYSARWIDMGDNTPADVLPDRQGFAYNDTADRDRLMVRLANHDSVIRIPPSVRDETSVEVRDDWSIATRRAGGYIYVDAWLTPSVAEAAEPHVPTVVEVPMIITELPERTWEVWCLDGAIRHNGTFATLTEAREWADTGHACAKAHTFVEVWS